MAQQKDSIIFYFFIFIFYFSFQDLDFYKLNTILNKNIRYTNHMKAKTYLFNSMSCLQVWIVPCTYCSHWCWFITCIRLRWIFKVRVWSTRTIHTNISCHVNVWTAVRLTHDCYHCYLQKKTVSINLWGMIIWTKASSQF